MATSGRKLNLRAEADRSVMFDVLRERGIHIKSDALHFACSRLSDDWLVAWASTHFNVRTAKSGTSGIGLADWAELVHSIFEMRAVPGIDEQIRRVCIPSHEALDTCLVLQIAGRYVRKSFSVSLEPNGNSVSQPAFTFRSEDRNRLGRQGGRTRQWKGLAKSRRHCRCI
jgi:hypothetical protein